MLNIKEKKLYYICIIFPFLLCLIYGNTIYANEQINKGPLSESERLLNVLKWDELYKTERERDVAYLLGNIDGESLQGLTPDQKKKLALLIQNIVIEQMLKEKIYIKSYLMMQYNQFFTPDELGKLIQYFNTELMQMIIDARIAHTNLSMIDIRAKIINGKGDDKKIISSVTNSYLYIRYYRFQEKIVPLVQEKIVNQLKIALSYALDQIPSLVENLRNNQDKNIQLDS